MRNETWEGYRKIAFEVNGRESYVVCPEEAAEGKPWVWRAEYFGAFDAADRALLKLGWHIGFHSVSLMYGSPDSVASMKDFHDFVCGRLGLNVKAALFGFSAGGTYSVNYAAAHPGDVRLLYLDAPALALELYKRMPGRWPDVCAAYREEPDELLGKGLSPNDKAEELARHGIPVIIVAGLADDVCVYEENGGTFARRFAGAGGEINTILKPGCGHHPHSLEDPAPIVEWILAH